LKCRQRNNADVELNDFTVSQQHNVDSTGLVCESPPPHLENFQILADHLNNVS